VPIQLAQCRFPEQAISNAKILYILKYSQPWEPALRQLYRRTFVPYYYSSLESDALSFRVVHLSCMHTCVCVEAFSNPLVVNFCSLISKIVYVHAGYAWCMAN